MENAAAKLYNQFKELQMGKSDNINSNNIKATRHQEIFRSMIKTMLLLHYNYTFEIECDDEVKDILNSSLSAEDAFVKLDTHPAANTIMRSLATCNNLEHFVSPYFDEYLVSDFKYGGYTIESAGSLDDVHLFKCSNATRTLYVVLDHGALFCDPADKSMFDGLCKKLLEYMFEQMITKAKAIIFLSTLNNDSKPGSTSLFRIENWELHYGKDDTDLNMDKSYHRVEELIDTLHIWVDTYGDRIKTLGVRHGLLLQSDKNFIVEVQKPDTSAVNWSFVTISDGIKTTHCLVAPNCYRDSTGTAYAGVDTVYVHSQHYNNVSMIIGYKESKLGADGDTIPRAKVRQTSEEDYVKAVPEATRIGDAETTGMSLQSQELQDLLDQKLNEYLAVTKMLLLLDCHSNLKLNYTGVFNEEEIHGKTGYEIMEMLLMSEDAGQKIRMLVSTNSWQLYASPGFIDIDNGDKQEHGIWSLSFVEKWGDLELWDVRYQDTKFSVVHHCHTLFVEQCHKAALNSLCVTLRAGSYDSDQLSKKFKDEFLSQLNQCSINTVAYAMFKHCSEETLRLIQKELGF